MIKLLKILATIFGIFLLLIGMGIVALGFLLGPKYTEVQLIPSPDKVLIASVQEINGGATTSFGYEISVGNRNRLFGSYQEVAYLAGVARNNCAYGVDLEWESNDTLLIKYMEASRDVAFYSKEIKIEGRTVFIKPTPGTINASAPCGGMEYNLTK